MKWKISEYLQGWKHLGYLKPNKMWDKMYAILDIGSRLWGRVAAIKGHNYKTIQT